MGLGIALTFGVLSLPPVQAWILRRALATQPDTAVDFAQLAFGPRGAEATDIKLRLPNLTVEARALRLAISPWQLLSRRRLAIADLQAKQLTVQATPSTGESTAPFTGVLDSLQAPLAWACDRAEADGVITVLQPGAPSLVVTFALNGANLDITKPGRLDFEFSTPGEFIFGFKGTWKFTGTLDFVPGAGGRIDALTIAGTLSPALSETLRLPAISLRGTATRTTDGEHYAIEVSPNDAEAAFTGLADFKKSTAVIAGTWRAHGASQLIGQILQRTDLPTLAANSHGEFTLNTPTGEADATARGEFTGAEWQRFEPTLAAIGELSGHHTASLQRRQGIWTLIALNAAARSAGSDATLRMESTRPLALPPGGNGQSTPWGKITVEKIPLGWAAPLIGVAKLSGNDLAGSWSIASPDAGTLRFESLGKATASSVRASFDGIAEDKIPPLALEATSRLVLTAETAHLELPAFALISSQGDTLRASLDARVSLDSLQGKVTAAWHAQLPTWLGGAQAPTLHGNIEADTDAENTTVRALRITATHGNAEAAAFTLESLAPLKFSFDNPSAIETAEGDVLKFTANQLRLDWTAPLLPGFTFNGSVAQGSSTLRREGREFVISTHRAWELRDVSIAQGSVPLLRASEFSAAPEGRVQLNPDWSPGDFLGRVALTGKIAEVFGLRDPAGEFHAEGRATGSRRGEVLELRDFNLTVKQSSGAPLLELETLQPVVLGPTAKNNHIDQAPDWLRLRTRAIPLDWFQPFLPAGMEARGQLEPAEFSLKMELPNAFLRASKPVAVAVDELRDGGEPMLRNVRVELSPSVIVMGLFSSVVLEDVRLAMAGRQTGSGGLTVLYLTKNLTLPVSTGVDFSHDVAALRTQPFGATLALPPAGSARFIYQHDLTADKKPTGTFLLDKVPTADGQGMLPPLGIRVTQLDSKDPANPRIKLEFQYQTKPTWSQFNAEFSVRAHDKTAEINTTLTGEFFDLGQFMRLIDACAPAVPAPVTTATKTPAASPMTSPTEPLPGPFWQTLRARFDLDFTKLVYDDYQIDQVRGELAVDAEAIHLRQLTGRMFDGQWHGNFRMDYDWQNPAKPYVFAGGFDIENFSAAKVVEAAYPNEIGSFAGRLNFFSRITSRTWSPFDAIDQSVARFEFSSADARLKLNVPYANVASAGLLIGGAITFSPELRALGRLIKKFSDLPVDTLAARGQRDADGSISLDEFKLSTPQLRLVAHGRIPFQKDVELAARPFELPVILSAKDEIAVILRGMKLLEKKADADGYFAMTKRPALRGTIGAPDTTELYDTFAKAVDASSGTFGLLMKKVRQEVDKTQAKPVGK